MIKGVVGSLIAAAVFFFAGEITIKVLGTKSLGEKEFGEMELFEDASGLAKIVGEGKFTGEKSWEFDAAGTLGIVSSKTETAVRRIDGGNITLTVKTSGGASAAVTVVESKDGYLGISVRGNTLLLGSENIKVEIGLPDKEFVGFEAALGSGEMKASEIKAQRSVLDIGSGIMKYEQAADFEAQEFKIEMNSGKVNASEIKARSASADVGSGILEYRQAAEYESSELKLNLSSGKLNAAEIRAKSTEIDVGSGVLEYVQALGYKGEKLNVDIGSGSVKVTNADVSKYEISMGSGKFDVSGLTGSGEIDIGSGKGTAEFAAIDPRGSEIDMSSGSLEVYVPRGCGAQIDADISTGSVKVDCCGVDKRFTKDGEVTLGGGGGKFAVDVSSGKVEFLESKRFFDLEQAAQIEEDAVIEE